MNKKGWALILLMVLLVSGCAVQPQSQPQEKVEDQTPIKYAVLKGPTALGMLPMIDQPKLKDGTPIDIEVLPSPDILIGRLASGELDFATVPTNLAAKLYGKNGEYPMIAMNTWGAMYIIGKNTDIKTLADLKGTTLYSTGKGTTPEIVLNYLLKQQGIDTQKEMVVDSTLAPVELAQAAVAGKVDAALLPEPFVTMVLGKNAEFHQLMDLQALYQEAMKTDSDIPQTCLVVKASVLKENPEKVAAFIDAYKASMETALKDPAGTGVLSEKHDIIKPAALAEKAIPRSGIRYQNAQDAQKAVEAYLKILQEVAPESIGGKVPDEGFYTTIQ